jgi:hypothetical protein
MRLVHSFKFYCFGCAIALTLGCSGKAKHGLLANSVSQSPPFVFKVDPASVGSVTGSVHFTGKNPARKPINMSEDPACIEAHHGKAYDESLIVSPSGSLANAFIYIEKGLEGRGSKFLQSPLRSIRKVAGFVHTSSAFKTVRCCGL